VEQDPGDSAGQHDVRLLDVEAEDEPQATTATIVVGTSMTTWRTSTTVAPAVIPAAATVAPVTP
jgi:hypothetical protein